MTSPAAVESSRVCIPIAQLFESPTNYRKVFDAKELAEMAESMKNPEVGVIQPLVIRPASKNGKHEIIAGAKRFRSAKLAGLKEVPVTISDASDAGVREMQLIENLHRSDPHPLEQAQGFRDLMTLPNYNADVIAAKIGADRSFVYKRMQLTLLTDKLKELFLEAKINIGHALQLCRLREEDQIDAAKNGLYRTYGPRGVVVSVGELAQWIEQNVYLRLAAAPWDKADVNLVPAAGACTACPKRTGANLALFDDLGKDDKCLDRTCFQTKQAAFIAITVDDTVDAGFELVKVAKGWQERQKKHAKDVVGPDGWNEAKKGKCEKPERAIIVAGEELGRRLKICRQRGCKHHGGYQAPRKTKDDRWADRARQLPRKIDSAARAACVTAVMLRVKTISQTELELAAHRLMENLDGDQLVGLAIGINAVIPPMPAAKKDGRMHETYAQERHVRKFLEGHLVGLKSELLGKFIVGAVLADTYDDKKRNDMIRRYKVEPKAIRAKIATRMQAEFAEQKKAALAAAKPAKKKAAK